MTEEPKMPGAISWYGSGEDTGPDAGISVTLPGGGELWCGEASEDIFDICDIEPDNFGGVSGWWIVLSEKRTVTVLGKAVSKQAASVLMETISRAILAATTQEPRP